MSTALKLRKLELTPEQQEWTLNAVMDDMGINEICRNLDIVKAEFYDYCIKDPLFSKRMKQIREYWIHDKVYSLMHITDSCNTMAEMQGAKITSDNIKWSASKVIPHIYGDNLNVNVNHTRCEILTNKLTFKACPKNKKSNFENEQFESITKTK